MLGIFERQVRHFGPRSYGSDVRTPDGRTICLLGVVRRPVDQQGPGEREASPDVERRASFRYDRMSDSIMSFWASIRS